MSPFSGMEIDFEKYEEIPSDIGIPFNVQPKMKTLKIAHKARDAILSRNFDQVWVNIADRDMVGHTGDIEAIIVACKAADEAVKDSWHNALHHTARRIIWPANLLHQYDNKSFRFMRLAE